MKCIDVSCDPVLCCILLLLLLLLLLVKSSNRPCILMVAGARLPVCFCTPAPPTTKFPKETTCFWARLPCWTILVTTGLPPAATSLVAGAVTTTGPCSEPELVWTSCELLATSWGWFWAWLIWVWLAGASWCPAAMIFCDRASLEDNTTVRGPATACAWPSNNCAPGCDWIKLIATGFPPATTWGVRVDGTTCRALSGATCRAPSGATCRVPSGATCLGWGLWMICATLGCPAAVSWTLRPVGFPEPCTWTMAGDCGPPVFGLVSWMILGLILRGPGAEWRPLGTLGCRDRAQGLHIDEGVIAGRVEYRWRLLDWWGRQCCGQASNSAPWCALFGFLQIVDSDIHCLHTRAQWAYFRATLHTVGLFQSHSTHSGPISEPLHTVGLFRATLHMHIPELCWVLVSAVTSLPWLPHLVPGESSL